MVFNYTIIIEYPLILYCVACRLLNYKMTEILVRAVYHYRPTQCDTFEGVPCEMRNVSVRD